MAGKVTDRDLGWEKIKAAIRDADGWGVTTGVHAEDAANDGSIDNVGLAVTHEFGATFQHPGGTPYTFGVFSGGSPVRFLQKGDPRAVGVTRPHQITIPERSFLRAAFDNNAKKYIKFLANGAKRMTELKATAKQIVGQLGELAVSDVINLIRGGIGPPLKPATIARKGSSTPLIDIGQLVQSLKPKVQKGSK